ncbi:uncharacterized protein LOC133036901 [Cannabis sativa]|uniref:uncharacterized protein LOC133036901 n=1 Tax=Cannabis sativa TaxID=3483 RepID=UPI0029C9F04C|nr:uncharacterized protein LOC133036901 [Cannabis sativa]
MAKTRSKQQGKSKAYVNKPRKKGPNSESDVIRTKKMDAVLGIAPLELSEEDEEPEDAMAENNRSDGCSDFFRAPLSPTASLNEIKRTEEARSVFLQFVHANNQCNSSLGQGMSSIPPVLRSGSIVKNLDQSFVRSERPNKVKINFEDIEDEVNFWSPSIVCYVLGSNPPLHILEGFAKRIWTDKVDKVKLLAFGIFLIRFNTMEIRDQVLNGGYIFFNKRPVIMKPWDPNTNFRKEDVKQVPIWVHLEDLELKYWGQKSLFKIVGQVGKPIMVDSVTRERERLNFPRILIEVQMNQELPNLLEFEDEYGSVCHVGIQYEWKPITCSNCSGLGHKTEDCRNGSKAKQEWVIKEDHRKANPIVDNEGFQAVSKGKRVKEHGQVSTRKVQNGFQALADNEELGNGDCELVAAGPVADAAVIDSSFETYLTVVYGANDNEGRKLLWADLCELSTKDNWLVMRDFNAILAKEERVGHRVCYHPDTDFIQCVQQCQLEDVKATGCYFTWSNKQQGKDRIVSKIDRISANQEWLDKYPNAEAMYLNEGTFDHSPAILSLHPKWKSGRKPFKYFMMWSSPKYVEKVSEVWQKEKRGTRMYQLMSKLKELKAILKEINREGFSDVHAQFEQSKADLNDLQDKLQQGSSEC